MTGGLQEQVTDGEEWFGIGIEPASKAIIGSQDIPYIREDRLNEDDFINALCKMYEMTQEERQELGKKCRQHVLTNYGFEDFQQKWVETMDHIIDKYGSWDTRKNYQNWSLKEVK